MTESKEETRKNERKNVNVEVEFKGTTDKLKALTANLSLGGMFVVTKKPLPISDKAFFNLKAFDKPLNFTMEGEVIWNNGRGCKSNRKDFPSGMGIRFIDSKNLTKDAIESFVGFIEQASFDICSKQ